MRQTYSRKFSPTISDYYVCLSAGRERAKQSRIRPRTELYERRSVRSGWILSAIEAPPPGDFARALARTTPDISSNKRSSVAAARRQPTANNGLA